MKFLPQKSTEFKVSKTVPNQFHVKSELKSTFKIMILWCSEHCFLLFAMLFKMKLISRKIMKTTRYKVQGTRYKQKLAYYSCVPCTEGNFKNRLPIFFHNLCL